jgi:hypothetical protein
VFFGNIAKAQFVEIPDSNFRKALMKLYPTCFNASNQMDTTCSEIVNAIDLLIQNKGITSLEGINYFKNLQGLDCDTNQLSILPILPSSLRYLFCNFNQLISLPELPSFLNGLYCSDNKLKLLPEMPNSIIFLDCSINQLSNLPNLPESLGILNCYFNQISNIPPLPFSLQTIICSKNNLMSLPNLPNSLVSLYCDNNHITTLPTLPFGILDLYCESNNLYSLPTLPNTLEYLNCRYNPIDCLPILSNALFTVEVTGTNIKCLPNTPPNSTIDTILPICTNPSDICQVTGLASNNNLDFKLFPNPTNGSVRIELPYNGDGNWILSDISGRQIKTDNIANGEKIMELNLSDLPSGTYFITIQLGNNVSTAKVMKM